MSTESAKSYLKVPYDLRPAKQVERRMFLDFFRRLAGCGVPVEEFRYTGMGSIHFIDHILFHKFLGIDKLVSVESDEDIEERMRFNCPFDSIEVEIMPIGDYVPRLDRDEAHIVWLDYDFRLTREMINDVVSGTSHLPPGSFILVTVDVEPHKGSKGAIDNLSYYKKQAGDLWNPSWGKADFSNARLYKRAIDILDLAFKEGMSGRPKVKLLPCFCYVYSDGHRMVTLGGQIGGAREASFLDRIQESGASYLVRDFAGEPFAINVPVLTRKERLHLESVMPSEDFKKIRTLGISRKAFDDFAQIYRFFPSYGELLLG